MFIAYHVPTAFHGMLVLPTTRLKTLVAKVLSIYSDLDEYLYTLATSPDCKLRIGKLRCLFENSDSLQLSLSRLDSVRILGNSIPVSLPPGTENLAKNASIPDSHPCRLND